nr:hypothetical protein [Candidatus Sigynarchaeota archaeon]
MYIVVARTSTDRFCRNRGIEKTRVPIQSIMAKCNAQKMIVVSMNVIGNVALIILMNNKAGMKM